MKRYHQNTTPISFFCQKKKKNREKKRGAFLEVEKPDAPLWVSLNGVKKQ